MSYSGETFFISVGCMDGRVQEPIISFGKKFFGVKYPDTITEAGLVGLLAKKKINANLLQSIKKKIKISLQKHRSKGIIIHGHQECAGNPVEDNVHKKEVIVAAKLIRSIVPENVKVLAVFLNKSGEERIVEKLNY